jgi:hypothetical protein
MIRYLKEVRRRRDTPSLLRPFRRVYYSGYLTGVFVFIKLIYTVNAIGQLFLVNVFLGTDFHLYGVDVVRRMATGKDWTTSHRFPRVTMCDFQIRVLGNVHRHTVQCALPMNLYNEMMFIFLWFWFVFVSAYTVSSLLYWSSVVVGIGQQVSFVRLRLGALGKFDVWGAQTGNINRPRSFVVDGGDGIELVHHGPLPSVSVQPPADDLFGAESGRAAAAGLEKRGSRTDLSRFVESYLTRDGCLIIRLVAVNSSDIIATELLGHLYDHYVRCGNGRPLPSNRSWLQMQGPSVSVTDTSRVCDSGDATLDKNDNPMSTFSTVQSIPPPPSLRCSPSAPRNRPSPTLSRHSANLSDAAMAAGGK